MASIKDVAKLAGVSPSTVSLMLNNTGYVSAETREKIASAIQTLDYTPNELARNLSKNRSNIVGVIAPDVIHPYCGTLVKYIDLYLSSRGYKTMLCSASTSKSTDLEYINMLKRQTMDGIIATMFHPDVPIDVGKPFVSIDGDLKGHIPVVMSNHRQEGEIAASLFLKNGCRHVVHLTSNKTWRTLALERNEILAGALEENGVLTDVIELNNHIAESSYLDKMAQLLFDQYPDVDGIFGSELFLCHCQNEAKIRGKRIPEDLKLIACDGTFLSDLNRFTAIVQPLKAIAKKSVDLMVDLTKGKKFEQRIYEFNVSVQKGETTVV